MCGLAGFWAPAGAGRGGLEGRVAEMVEALEHRGPDDRGAWVDESAGLAFGFRRLSILDLSAAGHQPMHTLDGRLTLVFNGEVYNFRELRSELEDEGFAFRSEGDTEVVLRAMEAWGIERALGRFNGMFALALWDAQERTLHLARDRMGIKPLYWGICGDTFFFASELKALRRHPDFRPELDRDALALFFRHNYIPAPHTIYACANKLEPGTLARIRGRSDVQLRPYWTLREVARRGVASPCALDPTEAASELERLLGDAVERRLVADVPLGAFLSGGIDSSTVVALMQSRSSRAVQTFSIGFHEAGFDEAVHARAVAAHLGTEHHELYVTPEQALDVIPSLPDHWDEPFSDSSQIPTYLVSRFAREQVTVSLSGDGGDELFGGYSRYGQALRMWPRIARAPRAVRSVVAASLALGSRTLTGCGLRSGRLVRRTGRLAELLGMRDEQSFYRSLISHWRATDELVLGAHEPVSLFADRGLAEELPDFLERMMFLDSVTYLPDDILCKVDRASMAVSLEARVPLLDHEVVEFAWTLPRELRVGGGAGKRILRDVLSRHVPQHLFERPKMGFGVPLSAWLRGPLRGWCEELLNARRLADQGILAVEPIRRRWEEHVAGKQDWGYHLWDVLIFQAWHERWCA